MWRLEQVKDFTMEQSYGTPLGSRGHPLRIRQYELHTAPWQRYLFDVISGLEIPRYLGNGTR